MSEFEGVLHYSTSSSSDQMSSTSQRNQPAPTLSNKSNLRNDATDIQRLNASLSTPKRGAANYSMNEIMHLLRILEDVVPVCKTDWNNVLAMHTKRYPGQNSISIFRKLQGLHRKKIPTGNPNMHDDVRLAKDIKDMTGRSKEFWGRG